MSKIKTYFTTKEYNKYRGEEIIIRKCDVGTDLSKGDVLTIEDQEKMVYSGHKEYESTYIWGQLVGWFKQTVDKPNASLSADRRGTISMPDLESFIIASQSTKVSSGLKSKSRRGNDESSEEEIMPQKTTTR